MLTPLGGLILGVVQGLTEFLPVSSSGHLILARELLGANTEGGLAFDAILQLATVLAVLLYFRADVLHLITQTLRLIAGRGHDVPREDRRLIIGLILGTIPGVFLGLLLEQVMETTFRDPRLVAVMLLAGSFLFLIAERFARQRTTHPTIAQSWWIGWFQTLALVPGVSRSGATISGGLLLGLTRETAARFSFLLSIPIIMGSGAKKLVDVLHVGVADASWTTLLIGFGSAFIVGYGCIRFLLKYLKTHTLAAFAWYRVLLAVLVIVFLSLR